MLGTTKSLNSLLLRNGYSVSSHNQYVKKKKRKTRRENCIQQFLRLWHPRQQMYVGCWIIDFDQETKIHTLQFTDLHVEKFNLKEEEWHFLLIDSSDEEWSLPSHSIELAGSFLPFGVYCNPDAAIWSLLQPWCLRQACARSGILRCNCWFPLPNWTTPLDCIVRWVPQDARKQNKVFGDFGVPTSLCCVPWKCAWYVGYCQ